MKLYLVMFLSFVILFNCAVTSTKKQPSYKWTIHGNGVGSIEINKPLPIKIINKKKYFHTYIADGIIFEGFKINTPHILVGIKNGPLSLWEQKNSNQNPDIDLSLKAVEIARKNAIVDMIVINNKKYKTQKSIGVGSSYNEFKKAYPDLKKNPVPPTFGKDLCSASTVKLQKVFFYFKNCKVAEKNGKILRIMIFQ